MRVVQWSAPERTIDKQEAGDFYDRPLTEPWLFHFTTRGLRLDPHEGPFSLKLVVRGEERYRFGSRNVSLRPGQLLFSAADRSYASEVSTPSECISLFLPQAAASEAWFGSTEEHDAIIDRADAPAAKPIPVAFTASQSVRTLSASLLQALERNDACESLALELVAESAQQWRNSAPVRNLTGPCRAATREELISRVVRARMMIEDMHGVGCELALLAEEACLSKFHLLRVFKEAFCLTPGQYARHVRIRRAREAELAGVSVGQASRLAGYSRPSTLRRAAARVAA